ncbi:glycerol-3-phosphate dehydrogenase, partial [Nitrospinaceae bacterium]|nr:glycerol-3-phosphate dehydrogenase [Nitrospinaceae bacterium]
MSKKSISVIGAGSWGTALSIHLARIGHKVNLWVYEKLLCEQIKETKE